MWIFLMHTLYSNMKEVQQVYYNFLWEYFYVLRKAYSYIGFQHIHLHSYDMCPNML